jgi:hypothetical protein
MSISVPIVAFLFVCIIFPHIVRNKAQFYMAFAVLIVILLLEVVEDVAGGSAGLARFFHVVHGVLYVVDLVLFVLCAGGLSLHELTGEFKNAYEVMRRGENTPTVVIPKRDNPYSGTRGPVDEVPPPATPRYDLTPPSSQAPGDEGERSIPLE